MILVDSSAWIEYYRRDGSEEVRDLVFSAIRDNRAATNGIIKVEIVAYATRDADSLNVRSDLSGCHWLELTGPVFELAGEMGRKLRTLGVTVPATDLIIASSARHASAELLHFDGHFELIAEHLPLFTLGPLKRSTPRETPETPAPHGPSDDVSSGAH